MRSFSVRALMAVIVVPAIGLTALRNANDWWAGIMLTLALLAVGGATVGAVFTRGRERAWWGAYAFFAGTYLILAFAPGFATAIMPLLPSTKALNLVYADFVSSSSPTRLPQSLWWQHERVLGDVNRLMADGRKPGDGELDSAMRMLINLDFQLRVSADQRDFLRVGHALFALATGLLGGSVGWWFHSRGQRVLDLVGS